MELALDFAKVKDMVESYSEKVDSLIDSYVDDLNNLLKEGTPAERRAFIRSFIKEIRVTGNEAVLTYTIPILPEKVTIEKEGVLPTVQYSGRYWT